MTDSVVVGVRVRPLNARETANPSNLGHAWSVSDNSISRHPSKGERQSPSSFLFDHVFRPDTTNEEVYQALAAPIVESALGGFNATVFAYGQTSSGKTYSMLGHAADPGITPLAIQHVLRTVTASKTRQFLIRVAYVEIYNDKIRDLQNPTRGDLTVREDKAGRVFVDAEETIVESFEDVMAVLDKGQAARHVGETKMNARSSRSHTIFTLHIESKGGEGVGQSFRASSLNLVDLAGSERLKSTGAEGTRQKEGAHINKSLLVLGTIINRLSSASGDIDKIGHLPYRDSKLTRLLRPALGGNAKTAVLCAVTPSKLHVEETLSTLKFAERAKKVTTNATRNEVVDYRSKYKEVATELALLRDRYLSMEAEIAALRSTRENGDMNGGNIQSLQESSSFEKRPTIDNKFQIASSPAIETANAIALSVDLQASREEIKYLKEHVDEVETENEHLREQLKKKAADFRGLRCRALELRSAARKARSSEKAVRRAMVLSFRKLEEARQQLDVSRKKGAHVKIAEGYLLELSQNLKTWLPTSSFEDSASMQSSTPPASMSQDDHENRTNSRCSTASETSVASSGKRRSSFHSREDQENHDEGNTPRDEKRSLRPVRRRPRPLPEDMVADIDDSEAETDHPMPLDDDDDDDDDDDEDEELDGAEKIATPPLEIKIRISDDARDVSAAQKPRRKPKGWKAFKSFYGYGYTERGAYDRMVGGHNVPSTATHIST